MEKEQLLNDLKSIVLKGLPNAVKEIKLEKGDKVCYISMYASDTEPIVKLIQLGIESYRNEVIDEYGIDDKWVIWNSAEMPVTYGEIIDTVDSSYRGKQKYLVETFGDDWEVLWEECQAIRFDIAQTFNQYDWSDILPVTEDFVVYAEWEAIDVINGDLKPSIPQEKYQRLIEKNLI